MCKEAEEIRRCCRADAETRERETTPFLKRRRNSGLDVQRLGLDQRRSREEGLRQRLSSLRELPCWSLGSAWTGTAPIAGRSDARDCFGSLRPVVTSCRQRGSALSLSNTSALKNPHVRALSLHVLQGPALTPPTGLPSKPSPSTPPRRRRSVTPAPPSPLQTQSPAPPRRPTRTSVSAGTSRALQSSVQRRRARASSRGGRRGLARVLRLRLSVGLGEGSRMEKGLMRRGIPRSSIRARVSRGLLSPLLLGSRADARAVGYGPNYHRGPSMGDKIKGTAEIIEGKVRSGLSLVRVTEQS